MLVYVDAPEDGLQATLTPKDGTQSSELSKAQKEPATCLLSLKHTAALGTGQRECAALSRVRGTCHRAMGQS